jgi:hypothetical protein
MHTDIKVSFGGGEAGLRQFVLKRWAESIEFVREQK